MSVSEKTIKNLVNGKGNPTLETLMYAANSTEKKMLESIVGGIRERIRKEIEVKRDKIKEIMRG